MKQFNNDVKLLFTDTDSLCMEIKTDDLYNDMKEDKHFYDFSDYPKDHFLYDESNKKVIGRFKDETSAMPIREFIGIRSKLYSILIDYDKIKQTAKGIKKCVVKQELKHNKYYECIFGSTLEDQKQYINMNGIKSKCHQVYTVSTNKCALCNYDDKNFMIDNINTLAYGNCKIKDFR